MIFRPDNSLIRKPKHSSTNDEIKEDFISKLPDALLIQILSLLPEVDAIRTSLLSNRWKYLWVFLPNLHLEMPRWSSVKALKFHDFVDQTLALRGGVPVKKFFLKCSINCDYKRVYDWLCIVVQCKVQELEVKFPPHRYKFCLDFFKNCKTLVELTFKGEFVLDVPEILFPCLKKINLVSVFYSGDKSMQNLISGCPVLKELYMDRQISGQNDYLQTCKVSSPSLKRFRISFGFCAIGNYKVVIDAPKLEYLYIWDFMSTNYSLTVPLSLVEAHISVTGSVVELVTGLSSAKILTFTYATIQTISHVHGLNMPMFPNLVKLVIGWGWNLLPVFLENMPNLDHITFSCGLLLFNASWNSPLEPPACLRFKMKEIVINYMKYVILNKESVTQTEFTLIRYLLKHSNSLETFTINVSNFDPVMREQLLNLYRGSSLCRLNLFEASPRSCGTFYIAERFRILQTQVFQSFFVSSIVQKIQFTKFLVF